MIKEELEKLESEQLVRMAEIWGIKKKISHKRDIMASLTAVSQDEYFLKNILEKLTPLQVQIYAIIIGSRNILTLGEISRKIRILPINVEKELAVLKHLMLVYQRKNRERITSNLDKYYPYEGIRDLVSIEENVNSEKIKYSIKKETEKQDIEDIDSEYKKFFSDISGKKELAKTAISDDLLSKILGKLSEAEMFLVDEAFTNGGIMEINAARIIMDEKKLHPEKTLRRLHNLNILRDVYYIDERFVRMLVVPIELFDYLTLNPVFPVAKGIKELQRKVISNEMDFSLDVKKLILFISNKGLTLAQSEKIKQADIKKSEDALLNMDMRLFPEKSQVHLIEIILPFLKLFELVGLRGEDIILTESYEEFLKKDPLEMLKEFIGATAEASEKRMVGNDVFLPIDVPFFKKNILDECKKIIIDSGGIYVKVVIARLIREWVVMSPEFRIKNFKSMFLEKRGSIVSALFYMHIFGLLEVEYPKRFVRISSLGRHFFFGDDISTEDEPGSVIINPDASMIAMPDKLSLYSLHLLKSFSELKDFDHVYNFQITKESMQEGLLLGNNVETFIQFLNHVSKNRVPQNLLFLISDWSEELPIVTIEERVVILETSNAKMMELLVGQVKGKKIIKKELSPTAVIIHKSRVQEIMEVAEKLEMIIKLVR